MIQEDKELLLKDLCARLPYNVVINCTEEDDEKTNFNCFLAPDMIKDIKSETAFWVTKPYLRSMSSMTEEEYEDLCNSCTWLWFENDLRTVMHGDYKCYDWLIAHHFDYRGLIPKGLAIEVTKENNPYK